MQAILVHPIVGILYFQGTDQDELDQFVYDTAEDIGQDFDLNEIGVLKSRITVCWFD